MRELETLQKILKGAQTTYLLGNGDLLSQLAHTLPAASGSGTGA